MLVWLADNLASHMEQAEQSHKLDLAWELDKFGLMIFTVEQLKLICLVVIRAVLLEATIVITLKMLAQSVYQSVSSGHS